MRKPHLSILMAGTIMSVAFGAYGATQGPVYAGKTVPASAAPIEGVWQIDLKGSGLPGVGANTPKLTADGAARRSANQASRKAGDTTFDLSAHCSNPGTPRLMSLPAPMQIVARGDDVTVLFAFNHLYRQIHVDGKPHEADYPTAAGLSIGTWKDGVLKVVVTDRNDKTLLDNAIPNSSDLKVEETYAVSNDGKQLTYKAVISDPQVLAEPWERTFVFNKVLGGQIGDDTCLDRLLDGKQALPDGF